MKTFLLNHSHAHDLDGATIRYLSSPKAAYKASARRYRTRLIESIERCERIAPSPPPGFDRPQLVDPLVRRAALRNALVKTKRSLARHIAATEQLNQAIINTHATVTALRIALMPTRFARGRVS